MIDSSAFDHSLKDQFLFIYLTSIWFK